MMEASEVCEAALQDPGPANDGYLSLQVVPEKYGTQGLEAVAFRANIDDARKKTPIKLWKLGVAVYCRPSDETIGEMRIHYAGFVHPGFG